MGTNRKAHISGQERDRSTSVGVLVGVAEIESERSGVDAAASSFGSTPKKLSRALGSRTVSAKRGRVVGMSTHRYLAPSWRS